MLCDLANLVFTEAHNNCVLVCHLSFCVQATHTSTSLSFREQNSGNDCLTSVANCFSYVY